MELDRVVEPKPVIINQHRAREEMIALAKEGVKTFEELPIRLEFNPLFRQDGSINLAFTQEEFDEIRKNVRLQNSLGVKTELLEPHEIKELIPPINEEKILGGAFIPTDGIPNPYAVLFGHVNALTKMGVEIRPFTKAKKIKVKNEEAKGVTTKNSDINAPIIINAAGGFAGEIAKTAGVKIPIQPMKREVLVTEMLKPSIDPAIISAHRNFYLAQMLRGEFACGSTVTKDGDPTLDSSLEFLRWISRTIVELIPQFAYVKIKRQWAGVIGVTPDKRPIIGGVNGVEGLYLACGLGG
ncbi:hypothetical protein AKJ57_06295 [candidate division MSBL1 archaeon SCGC-AAA259A05]|uniref:FAD dependent oxidoreductase domain-containing protein n=1 Tax=candidate division MSBL1 archaeon SCGC-AAA259A05 TaxID=1698259 RepID=A0A133U3P3_9EURY|nr:hypothetical protein AKJ57_06295 [candidate division MSBL1 archaeon SCGC-AAA259A05]